MAQTSSSAEYPSGSETIQRWIRLWNTVSLGMLLITSVIALVDSPPSWPTRLLILAFGLLYLLWYWAFIIHLPRWGRKSAALAVSFAVVMLGLAAMERVHSVYLFLLFSMYGLLFSVLITRMATLLTVFLSVLGAAIVITNNQMTLPEASGVIIGFGAATSFGIIMGRFISTIIRQNVERQQMINALQAARSELAQAERQAGILEERQRLAREIHDTLAQGFTSIVMQLEAADQALPAAQGDPALEATRQYLSRARSTARESLAEARRFVWALRTEPLERETLAQAVQRVAQREAEEAGIQTRVEISGEERALPSAYEVTLLRTVQEALANVRKHASARQVNVTLTYMDDQVIMDVQDDGQGFNPAQPQPSGAGGGFGLIGIRERAEQLGGSLIIESAPGEGATLVVALPLAPGESHDPSGEQTEAV